MKEKERLRNKLIILCSMLFLFITLIIIYVSNKTFALPNSSMITFEDYLTNENTEINFINITESEDIVFTVSDLNVSQGARYYTTINYTKRYLMQKYNEDSLTLKLEKSYNNSNNYTEIADIDITDASNQEIVYYDKVIDNQTAYYRLSLYINGEKQNIQDENLFGEIAIDVYGEGDNLDTIEASSSWIKTENESIVTTKYVDKNGTELSQKYQQTIVVGEEYYTIYPEIEGYTVVIPTDAEGIAGADDITVTYLYRKKDDPTDIKSTVTVHHYYAGTTEIIIDDEIIEGVVGDPYTTSPDQTFIDNGYTTNTPDNRTGVFTEEAQEVIYYYTEPVLIPGTVTVHHYAYNSTTPLAEDEVLSGDIDESYETQANQALIDEGYTPNVPNNKTGVFNEENQEVIYYYSKKYTLTVHYYLINTTEQMQNDYVEEIAEGTEYVAPISLVGTIPYTIETPANSNGIMPGNDLEVIYWYRPIDVTVTVHHYLAGTTTSLAPDDTIMSVYGEKVTTNPSPALEDYYTYEVSETTIYDMYTDYSKREFTYYYTPKTYKLKVHYFNIGDNVKLSPDIEVDATYGHEEELIGQLKPVEIEDYNCLTEEGELIGPAIGDKEIVFIYALKQYKVAIHHYLVGTTTKLAPDFEMYYEIHSRYTSEQDYALYQYDVTIPDNKDGEVLKDTDVNYYYTPKNYTITVHYLNTADSDKLLDDTTLTVAYGSTYETTPKHIDGFYMNWSEGKISGSPEQDEEIIYYYSKIEDGDIIVKYNECEGSTCVSIMASQRVCETLNPGEDCNITCDDITAYTKDTTGGSIKKDNETQEFVCKYTSIKGKPVQIINVDESQNVLTNLPGKTICENKKLGFLCKAECDSYEGYSLVTIPPFENITLSNEEIVKKCVYEKREQGLVKVIYQDEEGNILSNDKINGYVGETYNTQAKNITGYTLTETPDNKEGTFTPTEIKVIYTYKKFSNPYTGDSNIVPFIVVSLGAIACIGSASYFFKKDKKAFK